MVPESWNKEQSASYWFIDLDWYERNNRSFLTLAQRCLCPRCRKRLNRGELSAADLVTNIKECCADSPGFISGELTILESIFRLFLANGNEPLDLAGISGQLSEWLEGDSYRTSAGVLARLLQDERYYGIRRVPT